MEFIVTKGYLIAVAIPHRFNKEFLTEIRKWSRACTRREYLKRKLSRKVISRNCLN